MRVRAVLLAAALALAPLGVRAADLVVWWEKGFYPEADQAVRDDERVEPVYGEPDEVRTSEDEPGEPGRW